MKQAHNTTIDAGEVEKFSRQAGQWWDERGPFAPLHRMNPVRIQYILDQVSGRYRMSDRTSNPPPDTRHSSPLKGLRLLDIGCGGGLISEPMARLGASVTGIDASEENIAAAKLHATQSDLAIDYRCTTAEALIKDSGFRIQDSGSRIPNPGSYDIVLALEIVEHVADVEAFAAAACALAKPGGLIIFSTLNRTLKSYVLAIAGAEYLLRLVPRGTHDWNKFLKPHELANLLRRHHAEVTAMAGMAYSPLNGQWRMTKDISVNYLLAARKA